MWVSKVLDIVGAIAYITLLFLGIRLGFRKSFRIFLFIVFITIFNMIVFRIFRHFVQPQYIEIIDIGILIGSSILAFFTFLPLINRIYNSVGEIELALVSKLIGFLLFSINGIFLIGYFVIFSDIFPRLYYLLETSSFLRILTNIVKFLIGIVII